MTKQTLPDRITVRQIAGHIGAEIHGIDLSRPLTDDVISTIRAALLTHKVIFLRDQQLTHAEHIAFARRFGELTRRPGNKHGAHPDGFPQILTIDPDAEDARYGRDFEERYRQKWTTYTAGWHTDLTPAVNPPAISILRAETVPPFGGDTQWTNLVAAYNGLSEPLRTLIDGLRAEHTFFAGCQIHPADPEDIAIRKMNRDDPQVSLHPVVRVHPETGERALFVHPASVSRIPGLSPAESSKLLDLLFAQIIRPEYTVRFSWQPGSIAIWDNRATAHLAATDLSHLDARRTMYRVTVLGDRPSGPDGFTSEIIAGEPLAALQE
ncbi:TauD/TfdA family dioxygenase [Micromonospora sp. WMMD1082]|uniref:TauD/TfdA dioxygenase family protein n=1 Tax=Micromonospora sp. WMMD1082 TaxID=3016104 RepID=UPI002416582B|nr:TauD/TfdA family dioxygenase [Micromonospora sp. WMMD1082]MDG4795131.1 TauD/TfdA family dioxygenase [Micromonospora sp. WMMD1082]